MKRFKNILLVAGPDTDVTSSYKRALSLAKHNHARLMVLGVTDQLPDDLPRAVTTMAPSELQNIVVKEKLSQLEKLIKPARKKGMRAR